MPARYRSRSGLLVCLALLALSLAAAAAEDFAWSPDYPVGAAIPAIDAPDQDGVAQTFDSLTGENGLLLMFSRSFDWCPFCKAQLKGLVEAAPQFEALGLEVATITYDPVDTLRQVAEDEGIGFRLLHDEAVRHVNAFGIRNTDYSPGDFGYGIPDPGVLLIDADGIIRHKFAEADFRERPDWSDVLAAARKM